jgi:C4-type Zn-finger protein
MTEINANTCPICISDNIDCREETNEECEPSLHFFQYMHCRNCGYEYRNVFLLIEQQEVVY